jgi:hypothetical protein
MAEGAIDRAHDAWYRNLRRYGTVPHAGFGPGFEGTHRLRHQPCQHARRDPVHTNAGECEVLMRVQGAISEAHRAIRPADSHNPAGVRIGLEAAQ